MYFCRNFTNFLPFFSVAAAAASGLTNNPPANGTATFPNGAAGASPYVLSPQDQQQFLAAMSAGQILPGELRSQLQILAASQLAPQ